MKKLHRARCLPVVAFNPKKTFQFDVALPITSITTKKRTSPFSYLLTLEEPRFSSQERFELHLYHAKQPSGKSLFGVQYARFFILMRCAAPFHFLVQCLTSAVSSFVSLLFKTKKISCGFIVFAENKRVCVHRRLRVVALIRVHGDRVSCRSLKAF